MINYRIAFIPLARTTFDIPLAAEVTAVARKQLSMAGFELVGPYQLITDLTSALATAKELATEPLDSLVIFQASFADTTMVSALAEHITAPVFLWAIPEDRTGGRLRLNSLCGINLAGHALTLRGRRYDYNYAPPDDPITVAQISSLAAAGYVQRKLKTARIGIVGEHPAGMDSCHLDASSLKRIFGVEIVHIELSDVFTRARAVPAEKTASVRSQLDTRLENLATLEQTPLNGTLNVYCALSAIASEQNLDAYAVRCWPEFFTEMGCAACGAMSMLTDGLGANKLLPCSCEADINGTVTQLILQYLANAPAFGTDIVAMDFEKDEIALWHCGLAPLEFADSSVQPHGTIHSNRRVPLVMEFPLKPGTVTIARLSQATGEFQFVVGRGEMLSAPAPFSGTSGTLRLERSARRFFDSLMQEGLEHHISLVYGDHLSALLKLTRALDIPSLTL